MDGQANVKALFCLALWTLNAFASIPSVSGVDITSKKAVAGPVPGKTSVVVFLSPSCPCSRGHEAAIQQLSREFPEVAFLGVASGLSAESAAYFQERLPFPVVSESGYAWADGFGALNTPHAFVFSADGRQLYQGGVDNRRDGAESPDRVFYLQQVLQDIQAKRPLRVSQTRALGCAIRH
ncbi:thioredoxin family protein [bacterium]|nr:thioredoxin family protein [bacterium]